MGKYSRIHWTNNSRTGEEKPKQAFETLDEALQWAKTNRPDCQPYVCDVCGKWHLGHYRK